MRHSTFGNPMVEQALHQPKRSGGATMTVAGTARKTLGLVVLTLAAALWSWSQVSLVGSVSGGLVLVGLLGALGLAVVTSLRPHLAPWTAPAYAVVKGATLGAISWLYNERWEGLPMQAATITLAIAVAVAFVFATGKVRPSDRFRAVVASLTLGVLVLYLTTIALSLFGVTLGLVVGNSNGAIALNVAILALAVANLVVDFDYIEQRAGRADGDREWFAAFAVLTTLVWIYIEVLRLLAKINSRR
jgi:uncharacterized YccA/Bax inhibitor family protein